MAKAAKQDRMLSLDYLRGFFIVVIIIDHLSRWPSLLIFISGKAFLWVTAAEGFVLMSGLLIGYVRGDKEKHLPLTSTTDKLVKRATVLYLCAIISTLIYTVALWYLPLKGGAPSPDVIASDWPGLLVSTLTLDNISTWVYFLKIYAIYIFIAPLGIWMLRKKYDRILAVFILFAWCFGLLLNNPLFQWQILFFGAMIAGYHLTSIKSWWKSLKSKKRVEQIITSLTLVTLLLSILTSFHGHLLPDGFANNVNNLFPKEYIGPYRTIVAALWFIGLLLIFEKFKKFIGKYFGWLLGGIGTQSLRAYIIHGSGLLIISYFLYPNENLLLNTLTGIFAVLYVWSMLQIKLVRKIIPS